MSLEHILGKRLAVSGIQLSSKHNTLFTAMDEYGSDSEVSRKAIMGLAKQIKADINLFRNVILPATKELEFEVKTKAKTASTTIADKVNIHTTQYNEGLDILTELNIVDAAVIANYTKLPSAPLIIEYDKSVVQENLALGNNRISDHVKNILLEYPEDYLEKLHVKIFGNVSNSNPKIMALASDAVTNYNELFLGLVLTLGYLAGTMPVSNIRTRDVRGNYLYLLRDIFVTTLSSYRKVYSYYIHNETLVSKITTDDRGVTDVTLVGETYNKYLETNSLDAIIGFSSTVKEKGRVSLSNFLAEVDSYQNMYDTAMRTASMRSVLDNVVALRLAYKLATREHLSDMTDVMLSNVGLERSGLVNVNQRVEEYVNKLSNEELLDTVTTSRHITSLFIYSNEAFLTFVNYMNHYTKLFPKLNVEEIATTAMVAHTIDVLSPQLIVTRGK